MKILTEILETGYINEEMKHGMINIKNPIMSNVVPKHDFIQIVLTIEDLRLLRNSINDFLFQNDQKYASKLRLMADKLEEITKK